MSDAKSTWNEVADRFGELGLKLKLHYEQAEPRSDEERDSVEGAVRSLRDALDHAFSAVGAAVRDQAVKDDVRDVAKSLSNALTATFREANERLGNAFGRKDDDTR